MAFVDPRRSQIDVVQAVGRAIRLNPDKSVGTVVIPVFVPEGDDPETVLTNSAFEPIWAVVRALRDHDEELAEQLDTLRRRLALERRLTTTDLPGRIIIDLPVGAVGPAFIDAFVVRTVERTTPRWEEGFAHLLKYVERQGHARVPRAHQEQLPGGSEFDLGGWVASRRDEHRTGTLSAVRAARLEALSGWTWEPWEDDFEEGMWILSRFVDREGHAAFPPVALKSNPAGRSSAWVPGLIDNGPSKGPAH